MQEIWHSISYGGTVAGDAVFAEARVEAGSPWFSGHFPEEPILPAIAVLSMVAEVISRHAAGREQKIRICSVRRVRFRAPVRPEDSLAISVLTVEAENDNPISYHFKVAVRGNTACTGIMDAETSFL
jgi:3-hydroxyacyl-[acyl-carrier-protein] dehydratase